MLNEQGNGSQRKIAAVIMAAGQGKRMKDPSRAKVMYELNDKPMIHYVVALARSLGASRTVVVTGHQRQIVMEYLSKAHPEVVTAVQDPQLGTGHAVMQSLPGLAGFEGDVLVLSGDVPLLTKSTMENLLKCHSETAAVATILTSNMKDPTGYGRIIRNPDGSVKKIVEHRDASEEERKIAEINSGIYVFDKEKLFDGLNHITPNNAQNEYYLTDVFQYFWEHQWKVSALVADHEDEIHGINTFDQLEQARTILNERLAGSRVI
ncbi:MAG TPA: sugar phosphate nucleotidyltransferase [Bacteroidota bacterium]|nr:sugar phosphate nucleotidyltransferase [Bacteroidota bacterium]